MPKEKNSFPALIFIEGRTEDGQLIRFSCRPDDAEEVKQFLAGKICSIEAPVTKKVSVQHGGHDQYSRYEIEQHKYAGGCGCFAEVLEIKNPPDNRCGFIIHDHQSGPFSASAFYEFSDLASALAAFEKIWGDYDSLEKLLKKQTGFIRTVPCGALRPWFYAVGEEEITGDYVFPAHLQNDSVFRFGERFLVYDNPDNPPAIKTCMGCIITKQEADIYRKELSHRIVFWNDGTVWNEAISGYIPKPRPLKDDELWVTEAIKEFYKLLAGHAKNFSISLIDGYKLFVSIKPDKTKAHTEAGHYICKVTFTDGKTKEGYVDFKPTKKQPNVIQHITDVLGKIGKKISRLEITKKETKKGGKKWSGVFWGE